MFLQSIKEARYLSASLVVSRITPPSKVMVFCGTTSIIIRAGVSRNATKASGVGAGLLTYRAKSLSERRLMPHLSLGFLNIL